MKDDFCRRLGSFSISKVMIDMHPEPLMHQVFAKMVILRAEYMFTGSVDYMALCDDFDMCPPGERPPLYQLTFTSHEDRTITIGWERL